MSLGVIALLAGMVLWPAVLSAAVMLRAQDANASGPAIVYAAASRLCHQRVERSFAHHGAAWPVCARCLGLYVAAPAGAVLVMSRSRRLRSQLSARVVLAGASVPTLGTLIIEWAGVSPLTNGVRFAAALPLGMALGGMIVGVASGRDRSIG